MRVLIILTIFFASQAFAVDGYQDLKFGISLKQLQAKKKCSLSKDVMSSNDTMSVYMCDDFKMTPQKTVTAAFFLINDELLRVALGVGDSSDDFIAFAQALMKKYRTPSLPLDPNQASLFDQGQVDTLDIAWDGNTVILRQIREGLTQTTMILYSSPKFDQAMRDSKTKDLEDAL